MHLTSNRAEQFILENTALMAPPHVPEIRLHLANEAHALWNRTEEELQDFGLPPPFWAFAWAGGQGLARYVLDEPQIVRGKRVLDFASGSGLVAIAAAKAGARHVLASDIDPFCGAAVSLNSRANGVLLDFVIADLIGSNPDRDVVLAGDVFYDRAIAEPLMAWLARLRHCGAEVIVGDPGRDYLPGGRFDLLESYEIPVTRALEDAEVKKTSVWRLP
jgi:predicted nicotinamide N-methyase